VTDRQTDRILIAIPRLHYMQRGKNLANPISNLFLNLIVTLNWHHWPPAKRRGT